MAISNVVRVRSDGLSNSIATWRPLSASAVGACRPSERSAFHLRGELQAAFEIGRLEVEDRQEVLRFVIVASVIALHYHGHRAVSAAVVRFGSPR